MTLKEKIMKLQTYKMFTGEDTVYVERDDVLKLLEQSSCNDCVDRHSVDLLAYRYLREPTDNHVAFYEDFLDLPPVIPIRPKGHWIKVELPSRDAHECSECGNLAIFDGCRNEEILTEFCPHCGMEMEEVEE